MRVDNHYDDEILIAMLDGDPDALDGDPHLEACDSCRGILDDVRLMVDALHDDCVWDRQELNDAPVPETIALLRATAAQMNAEDAQAEVYLADMLAGPRETWLPKLEQHPEWRTAGVVRALVARAESEMREVPLDALEMSKIAVELAAYLRGTDRNLVPTAFRMHAYASFYTGSFADAMSSIDHADLALSAVESGGSEFDAARQMMIRALILNAQTKTTDAVAMTAASSNIFAQFGDRKRWLYGKYVTGMIEYSRRNLRKAIAFFEEIEQPLLEVGDIQMLAGVRQNLALCYSEENRINDASLKFMQATALLVNLGMKAEAARMRWSMAVMQLHGGKHALALESLLMAQHELRSLGMVDDALRVSLEIIEAQLALEQADSAAATARRLLDDTQMPSLAAVAVGYLREISCVSRIAQHGVQKLRNNVRRIRENPHLLFAQPPE